MKVIFTPIVLLFFCMSALPVFSGSVVQKHKVTITPKADSIPIKQKDSISNYSITINGQLNSVSITKSNFTNENLAKVGKPKNAANTIAINGERNSVTINQNTKGGQVYIQQKGMGNRVNISQSKPEK